MRMLVIRTESVEVCRRYISQKKNELADWIPCFTHSQDLVRHCVVDCVPGANSFSNFVERLYTFLMIPLISGIFC